MNRTMIALAATALFGLGTAVATPALADTPVMWRDLPNPAEQPNPPQAVAAVAVDVGVGAVTLPFVLINMVVPNSQH